jgi:hypothetical protein
MMCLAFDGATIEQVQSAECDLGHFGKTQAERLVLQQFPLISAGIDASCLASEPACENFHSFSAGLRLCCAFAGFGNDQDVK